MNGNMRGWLHDGTLALSWINGSQLVLARDARDVIKEIVKESSGPALDVKDSFLFEGY
jgi:hypothetical protein